ncbi:T9SS type A sorting domain-containing protein [Rasiella rasia]|uniref:T9SS type A sorting domain-containing protein n=1 Tax=Rasiella rasia TaxID=2744027 RepID=A0A6G6GQI0_9FLAO|nr:choice-of-anchor J domain-containing protein [Rasiella rasia]QIE60720.1 T9SS type A sorting domain-containing protein [Rasiella rasia]
MKRITMLMGLMLCSIFAVQSQTTNVNSSRTVQPSTPTVSMADVLERYNNLDTSTNLVPTDVFTPVELQMLRGHLNSTSGERMAVLLTEDFVDITTLPGAGYDLINVSDAPGATDWLQGNDGVFPAQSGAPTEYIAANFNNTGGSVINNFMITPPLDLENGDEIIFWSRSTETTPGFDFPDRLEVRIDPTGADTDPANSTDVGSYTELLLEINPTLASMGYPEVWTQFTATVSGLSGTVNTRVAFRYWVTNAGPFGSNSDYIGIDSLVIQEGGTTPPPATGMAFAAEGIDDEYINFDIATPAGYSVVGPSTIIYECGTVVDPTNSNLGIVLGENGDVSSLDFTTGVYTPIGSLPVPAGTFWAAMDVDSSGQVYALALDSLTATSTLYSVDLTALTSTMIGATGIAFNFALGIDENDVAYSVSNTTDSLYTIDLTSGVATLVGPTGVDTEFGQELSFDGNTNTMYLAAFNNGIFNGEWRSVDTATGATTSLGEFAPAGFKQITWVEIPVVVTNDECMNAIAMSCGDVEVGDTSTNTDTGGFNDSPDAWYSYTGSGDPEFVTFSLCDGGTAYDSRLTVYDVCGGVEIALNDDACGLQSEVSFLSDGTTTYFVAVEGFGTGDAGAFSLEVSCNPVAANDLCDDAIAVSCGDVISGSTNFATIDDAVAGNCDDTFDPTPFLPTVEVVSPGVWYSYTEPIPGFVQDITLDLCDAADFDTKISVYSGDCGALVCVAANDDNDDCTGFTSTVEFQSDGISTYYILVHGFNQTGNFDLSVNCAPVPPPNDMIVNSIDVDEIGFPYTDPAVNMPGATVEAGGTPADCDNAGVRGVWYNFVPEMGGTATASVTTPAAYTSVTFYTAPDEDSVETDLVLVDYFDNQCVPGADASILVTAGQPYYVYVANQGGVTDIVIDGDFYLGIGDTEIQGFSYFPNPAENQLNLRSGGGTIESAIIYNILGQEVLSERVGSSDAQLNVANLSVGTYILKVVVDGELGIYKIVKQ